MLGQAPACVALVNRSFVGNRNADQCDARRTFQDMPARAWQQPMRGHQQPYAKPAVSFSSSSPSAPPHAVGGATDWPHGIRSNLARSPRKCADPAIVRIVLDLCLAGTNDLTLSLPLCAK